MAAKATHTPGPWEVCSHYNGKETIYGVRNAEFGKPNPYPIDPILGASWRTAHKPDADLIAAAPEMYAAIAAILKDRNIVDWMGFNDTKALEQVRVAFLKAGGE